jgi:hypothetical protein
MNGLQASECPSHFALDDDGLHGGGRGTAAHVEGCARCQARLAGRAAASAHFDDAIAAPLWTRVEARAAEQRRQRRRITFVRWSALTGALGALAVAVVVGRTGRDTAAPAGYVGTKGQPAPVEIFCRRSGASSLLAPGNHVEPRDELRFRPRPVRADARFIQIGSVDGTGRYTPFYPSVAGAPSVALPANGQALDGAIRIDDAPGPERLFVVLSATPLSEAAVRRVAEPGAASGTTVDRIDGVPVTTAWIPLPKRAGGVSPL